MRGLDISYLHLGIFKLICFWGQTKISFFGNWMKDKSSWLSLCCQIILNNSSVIISWNFSIILGGSLELFHSTTLEVGGCWIHFVFFDEKVDMKISNFWSNEIFLKENDRLLVQNPILINYKPFIFLSTCLNLKLGFIEIWWSLKR